MNTNNHYQWFIFDVVGIFCSFPYRRILVITYQLKMDGRACSGSQNWLDFFTTETLWYNIVYHRHIHVPMQFSMHLAGMSFTKHKTIYYFVFFPPGKQYMELGNRIINIVSVQGGCSEIPHKTGFYFDLFVKRKKKQEKIIWARNNQRIRCSLINKCKFLLLFFLSPILYDIIFVTNL